MNEREASALRDHYDNADLSRSIDAATWEVEVGHDPMIVTSVRLPKSLLDWVREEAAAEGLKPTALIRRWIEDRRRAAGGPSEGDEHEVVAVLGDRVSRLEALLARIVSAEHEEDGEMADALVALRASVAAREGACIAPAAGAP